MTLQDAIIKSMKAYYSGLTAKELNGATGKRAKFTKSYFDKVGREHGIEPFELKRKRLS